MNPFLQLILASFLLGTVVAYLWWVRVRVWILRQDLFEVRDGLWDQMRASGELGDPAHREFRDQLNALIRLAPTLSVMTVAHMVLTHERFESLLACRDRPEAIEQARQKVVTRLATYILFESLPGLIFVVFLLACGMLWVVKNGLMARIGWLIDAQIFGQVDRSLSTMVAHRLTSA